MLENSPRQGAQLSPVGTVPGHFYNRKGKIEPQPLKKNETGSLEAWKSTQSAQQQHQESLCQHFEQYSDSTVVGYIPELPQECTAVT